MKFNFIATFILSLLLLFVQSIQAQLTPCQIPNFPFGCNINLVTPIFRDKDISSKTGIRYSAHKKLTDINYKNDNPIYSDCGNVMPYKCNEDAQLVYDVYYPDEKSVYPCYKDKPLPAVLLFHGGGFSDCSDYGGEKGIKFYCKEFAKRGFVAFNIEYRRGRLKDTGIVIADGGSYLSSSNLLATYRAFQDGRGALRSIIARQTGQIKTPYRIDTENIFVGGASSGAFIALSMAYYNSDMIDELFGDVKEILGPIDLDAYTGGPQVKYKIRGVLDLWGAGYIPAFYQSSPAAFFKKNKNASGQIISPPLIAFQGEQDITVPVKKANIYFSQDRFFKRAIVCIDGTSKTYIVPDNDIEDLKKDLLLFGTQGFYDILKKGMGIPVELYLDRDMRHGLGSNSDFGTSLNQGGDGTEVIPYIVQRAAVYFQAIANQVDKKLSSTKFVDCENFRKSCFAKDDNGGCGTSLKAALNNNRQSFIPDANRQNIFRFSQVNKKLYLDLTEDAPTSIYIFDVYGNSRMRLNTGKTNKVVVNCEQIPGGIYFLKVNQGSLSQTVKFSLL